MATPIGNLGDITLRALAALARADVVYCEDTRHSRTLLAHYSISQPLRPYHEHNAERERPRILAELAAGKAVALISDAGTPLVSDPGYKLVRACDRRRTSRHQPAGPQRVCWRRSAAPALPPTRSCSRASCRRGRARAGRGSRRLQAVPATLVFFEAPSRLAESLADIGEVLGSREAAVARELTKLHEEVRRGTPAELAAWAAEATPKGEMVILVGPPLPADRDGRGHCREIDTDAACDESQRCRQGRRRRPWRGQGACLRYRLRPEEAGGRVGRRGAKEEREWLT